jgi:hypothetical protein
MMMDARALRWSFPLLAAALFMVAAVAVAQAPAEDTETLEEVVVRGKHLSQEIDEAENRFFGLFNELNTDDRYDTHCVYLQMTSGSRIQTRACIPGFVADAMADWAPYKARCQPPEEPEYGPGGPEFVCLDRSKDGRISMDEASARSELIGAFLQYDTDPTDGYLSTKEFPADLPAPSVYQPPPPPLVLMEGSSKWYDHMMKVTNSDPRLKKMADHLGGLYKELSAAQRKYDSLEKEALPKAKPNPGPRSR